MDQVMTAVDSKSSDDMSLGDVDDGPHGIIVYA